MLIATGRCEPAASPRKTFQGANRYLCKKFWRLRRWKKAKAAWNRAVRQRPSFFAHWLRPAQLRELGL
jgi:hypothetical protein